MLSPGKQCDSRKSPSISDEALVAAWPVPSAAISVYRAGSSSCEQVRQAGSGGRSCEQELRTVRDMRREWFQKVGGPVRKLAAGASCWT